MCKRYSVLVFFNHTSKIQTGIFENSVHVLCRKSFCCTEIAFLWAILLEKVLALTSTRWRRELVFTYHFYSFMLVNCGLIARYKSWFSYRQLPSPFNEEYFLLKCLLWQIMYNKILDMWVKLLLFNISMQERRQILFY